MIKLEYMLNYHSFISQRIKLLNTILILFLNLICFGQRTVLHPVLNPEYRAVADSVVFENIDSEFKKYIEFDSSLRGDQCFKESPESVFGEMYECLCYNYRIRNGDVNVYIRENTKTSSQISVCFKDAEIVEEENTDSIMRVLTKLNENILISFQEAELISQDYRRDKDRIGSSKYLIYELSDDSIYWEISRQKGAINVRVDEIKIDAISGEIINVSTLPYRRTFWQWITGMKL